MNYAYEAKKTFDRMIEEIKKGNIGLKFPDRFYTFEEMALDEKFTLHSNKKVEIVLREMMNQYFAL